MISVISLIPMRPSESKWVQVSPSETKWNQVSPSESKWDQVSPSESKWVQVIPSESKWVQVSPSESKWVQVNPSESKKVQVSPSESNWVQVNPSESKWVLVSPSESKWAQMIPSESKWVQVSPSESKWVQVNPSESKWVQVSPSESKWGQVKPSEARWVQVNPGGFKVRASSFPPPSPQSFYPTLVGFIGMYIIAYIITAFIPYRINKVKTNINGNNRIPKHRGTSQQPASRHDLDCKRLPQLGGPRGTGGLYLASVEHCAITHVRDTWLKVPSRLAQTFLARGDHSPNRACEEGFLRCCLKGPWFVSWPGRASGRHFVL